MSLRKERAPRPSPYSALERLRDLAGLLPLILITLPPLDGRAQDALSLRFSGQVRHRTEFDARAFVENADEFTFHLLRTRLGVTALPLPDVGVFVQIQDARLFGGEDPALGRGTLDADADALDLHQAYFFVDDLFDAGLGLQVGRQELAYGNERLLGAVGWSNTGRAFDAGMLRYRQAPLRIDLLAAKLVDSMAHSEAQNLLGLYGTFALADDHDLDVFLLTDNDTGTVLDDDGDRTWRLERYTPGLYARGTASGFDYSAEAIYQFGHTVNAIEEVIDIQAYLLSGTLGYAFVPERAVRLAVNYTHLSGDDDLADDTARTFDTLFGTNHKFYGFMDYFPFNPVLRRYGLRDAFVSLGATVAPGLRLGIDVHHFTAAVPLRLALVGGPEELRTFGQEIDLVAGYRYNPHFAIEAGASTFFPSEFIERTIGDEQTYWLYLMTMVSF